MDRHTFVQFAECIADIGESVRLVNEKCDQEQFNTRTFIRAARNTSVAIRKVMLDKGGRLLKECVTPRLHPLKDPKRRHRKGLLGDILVERFEGMSIGYTLGPTKEERTFQAPAYEHRTIVNPLYGLRRTGKELYQLEDPFDLSKQPEKLKRWLNHKVLNVNDEDLSAERLLRLLVNYEGAHVNANEMTLLNASAPVELKLPDKIDELYKKSNWVTFGGISYLHIFTFLVGVYIVKMMQETLKHDPANAAYRPIIADLSESIIQSPCRVRFPALQLNKNFNTGVVLQNTGNVEKPIELVGDYGKPGKTTIQIPGWNHS